MKVTMSRQEALSLAAGLEANLAKYPGGKVSYAAAKNFRTLDTGVRKDVALAQASREHHAEYRTAIDEVLEDVGTLQQSGHYLIEDLRRQEYSEAIKAVQKKYPEIVEDIRRQGKEFEDILAEVVDIELHGLSPEGVVDNENLTGDLMRHLIPFLED